jgi:hypothetical protein
MSGSALYMTMDLAPDGIATVRLSTIRLLLSQVWRSASRGRNVDCSIVVAEDSQRWSAEHFLGQAKNARLSSLVMVIPDEIQKSPASLQGFCFS